MDLMDIHERATLGPLIRAAREGREWSQEELAMRALTTRQTISAIEKQRTTGQTKVIERVLGALGVIDGLVAEPDVKTFVQTITPLLQRLSQSEREQVMPAIVKLIAVAIERSSMARDVNAAPEEAAIPLVEPIGLASDDPGRYLGPPAVRARVLAEKRRRKAAERDVSDVPDTPDQHAEDEAALEGDQDAGTSEFND